MVYVLAARTSSEMHDELDRFEERVAAPIFADRERWGTDPVAQARQQAAMALVGGPAPMRDPGARRATVTSR